MNMFPKETITLIKDCGCEKGCQHKVIHVTQEFIIHKDDLDEFISDYM
jgi:hypothetical protein